MKRWFIPRDVQPFLDAVALAAGGVVLLDPAGDGMGGVAVAALERMAAARLAIDDQTIVIVCKAEATGG